MLTWRGEKVGEEVTFKEKRKEIEMGRKVKGRTLIEKGKGVKIESGRRGERRGCNM